VCWPLNFKASGIEKYDESTNLAEWLEVYQLAIEATEGHSYVMTNYLPSVCHHQPGLGSWDFPRGQSALGLTCVRSLSIMSGPHAHGKESTGIWQMWYRRRKSPSGNSFSASAAKGMASWRSTTSQQSCSSRMDSGTHP
jgi:hypothetical protein